jgi:hypothetical protein
VACTDIAEGQEKGNTGVKHKRSHIAVQLGRGPFGLTARKSKEKNRKAGWEGMEEGGN